MLKVTNKVLFWALPNDPLGGPLHQYLSFLFMERAGGWQPQASPPAPRAGGKKNTQRLHADSTLRKDAWEETLLPFTPSTPSPVHNRTFAREWQARFETLQQQVCKQLQDVHWGLVGCCYCCHFPPPRHGGTSGHWRGVSPSPDPRLGRNTWHGVLPPKPHTPSKPHPSQTPLRLHHLPIQCLNALLHKLLLLFLEKDQMDQVQVFTTVDQVQVISLSFEVNQTA